MCVMIVISALFFYIPGCSVTVTFVNPRTIELDSNGQRFLLLCLRQKTLLLNESQQ